uniref:Transparent testa 8 n=1 Tax=Asarum canadense TaxID=28498 RepID=A0A8A8GT74_ASACA|nr:transparent testa 8 [Asarum canadense]
MACLLGGRLQQMLQAAVQGVQWTYSLFWQVCPEQGILVWGDGYYNGAIKTRKTIQPMEVSAEEASLQRSQQLRELYESLSAGETNQPARRPCASLSPEDLTESEWFYLMCVSFSFPPGVGLPGRAYATRQHAWLTGANEADSKVFSRAILAKSARIQTVVCIPLMDGVLELGTTERVHEDPGLIEHAKSFFIDHPDPQQHSKPALSEHSTSNPTSTTGRMRFHSPPVPIMFTTLDPVSINTIRNPDEEEDDDDDEDEEDEEEVGSDSEAETRRENLANPMGDPLQRCGEIPHGMPTTQAMVVEPSELMQLEMSEDIRLGSPDEYSNNLDSEIQIIGTCNSAGQLDPQRHVDSYRVETSARTWPLLQDELSNELLPSEAPQFQELTQEDAHYSQTVSAILHRNATRWATSSPPSSSSPSFGYDSAFSKWSCRGDHLHLPLPPSSSSSFEQPTASQWMLKYMLLTVPFLHTKYKDDNSSPKSLDGNGGRGALRKGMSSSTTTQQDDLSANHVLAERRRREKLNERFIILRSLVPFVTKMDKASILGDTIEYVKQLRRRIQDLELRNPHIETDPRPPKGPRTDITAATTASKDGYSGQIATSSGKANAASSLSSDRSRVPTADRRKMRIVEGAGGVESPAIGNSVQVSIIESDALLELECLYREGMLIEILQTLCELRLEVTSVQSSAVNGVFVAEIRAKVKDKINGKKASIVEVKKAIHQIVPEF